MNTTVGSPVLLTERPAALSAPGAPAEPPPAVPDTVAAVDSRVAVPPRPSPALLAASAATPHHPQRRSRRRVARNLTKEYRSGSAQLAVLRDVSFSIPQATFVAIVGPSGSGKTTLLGLLAGLDTPTRGSVVLDGADLSALSEDARARLRGERVGFIFQSFQLIPTLTALENVQVPLELRGEPDAAARARDLLARVGLTERATHFPNQLSGGEQQRVAIARAFINRPRILFADEPTGNLDAATGERIVALLEELNRESGATIVLVTHDAALAARAGRVITMRDGNVVSDTASAERGAPSDGVVPITAAAAHHRTGS
jgi:putative ABC transport system ATP-binding protein